MSLKPFAMLLIAGIAVPVIAQPAGNTGRTPQQEYQRGYAATPAPHQAEINAAGRPGTAALNNRVVTEQNRQATNAAIDQAQYANDREAYRRALRRHNRTADLTSARYMRQRDAYAHAMADWRLQVAACKRGHKRICNLPTPNPADYY